MDYGKFKFEQTKREKEAKKNQRVNAGKRRVLSMLTPTPLAGGEDETVPTLLCFDSITGQAVIVKGYFLVFAAGVVVSCCGAVLRLRFCVFPVC